MANKSAALKAIRTSARRYDINRRVKTRIKSLRRKTLEAIRDQKTDEARSSAIAYCSTLDKAVKKGIIHKNAANREKSHYASHIFAVAKAS